MLERLLSAEVSVVALTDDDGERLRLEALGIRTGAETVEPAAPWPHWWPSPRRSCRAPGRRPELQRERPARDWPGLADPAGATAAA